MLGSGRLTQLEWIDACANALMLDGVEFGATHFPRIDDDYLAQLKKLCVDRCLTAAGLCIDTKIGSTDVSADVADIERWIGVAAALGAPIVRVSCAPASGSPPIAWRELIRGLKAACARAKQINVTLALQPADGSLVASPADVRRAFKECDSAWLRLAPTSEHLAREDRADWEALLAEAVIVVALARRLDTFGADETLDYRLILGGLWRARYRGFLSLEYGGQEPEDEAVGRAVPWLRAMLAKNELKDASLEA